MEFSTSLSAAGANFYTMLIPLEKSLRLLDEGFSLVTVGENKVPNHSWKETQTKPLTKEQFTKQYNYAGGTFKKNGEEMKATQGVGIITGYSGLEVIDVDLKVFGTLKEQQDFWEELLDLLKSNIDDFDLKFVIYKTRNQGYHIIYKCEKPDGNIKIAKLKGHKEAVIESRGVGGYVFVYDNKISKLSYLQVQTISDRDRDILWSLCRTYNYVAPTESIPIDKKTKQQYEGANTPTWDDYNSRVSIFDIIGDEFDIVKKLSDKYIIKRHGATSTHSGYVYQNGFMYLFSTGTIYPHEKLITPFAAYAIKNHNGDFSAAASDLYKKGYGSRLVQTKPPEIKEPEIVYAETEFPIDVFPESIQAYIVDCHNTLDSSIDYMGCSMLWLTSVVLGNAIQLEVKRGWDEISTVWIAIVGNAGIGKTPSINNVIYPLMKVNSKKIKDYIAKVQKFNEYESMSKAEKENHEVITKPAKQQFIANDITLEALVDLHQESKNAIGVFKDELNGWFKDMNKYRTGSDLEFWLSTWSGKSVSFNRKTSSSSFVDKPLISVLGGIQPSILNSFYTEENKDNGFVDRMLLSFPALEVERYNPNELSYDTIEWYTNTIQAFYEYVQAKLVDVDEAGEVLPRRAKLSSEAKIEWERIFNKITDAQNSDEENEYMKSMLPKQKTYVARFSLLVHSMSCYVKNRPPEEFLLISKESILKAEKLSDYFISMAKKIKVSSKQVSDVRNFVKNMPQKSVQEQFNELYRVNNKIDKKLAAETLGVSVRTIYRFIKELL
jgi:hypothetical protein